MNGYKILQGHDKKSTPYINKKDSLIRGFKSKRIHSLQETRIVSSESNAQQAQHDVIRKISPI